MEEMIPSQQVTQQETPIAPIQKKRRLLLLVMGSIVLLLIGVLFLRLPQVNKTLPEVVQKALPAQSTQGLSPTPFPFQEMTIPGLRERSYESTLGERELAYETDSYTAYIASYDSDGLRVNGLLTIPKGEKPQDGWPAIIFLHGYIPPSTYVTTGEAYASYVDYLASSGFVVFKIDLRGHGSSEGEPGGGYYGSDYVVDTLNAYAALEKASFVDPKHIGLWGHSMAGNITLRSLATRTEIPAAVVWAGAVYSYTDWQKYRINDDSYRPPGMSSDRQRRRQELFNRYGSPSAQSVFWQQVAPTSYLTDLTGAIQLHHAVNDTVVDIGYSRDLIALLDKTSVPHELYEYADGGHNISGGR